MKFDQLQKRKVLSLAVFFSSLIVYLEWGVNSRSFLIEGEIEFFRKLFFEPSSVLHPFTIIPLAGQLFLLYTLFSPGARSIYTYLGVVCLAILIFFILFIGIAGGNLKMIFSTLPFLVCSTLAVMQLRKVKKAGQL